MDEKSFKALKENQKEINDLALFCFFLSLIRVSSMGFFLLLLGKNRGKNPTQAPEIDKPERRTD